MGVVFISVTLCSQGELDELEREEFFRLKKVQAKKKRDAADKDQAVIQVGLCISTSAAPLHLRPAWHCACCCSDSDVIMMQTLIHMLTLRLSSLRDVQCPASA